jgi:hypothetical protein
VLEGLQAEEEEGQEEVREKEEEKALAWGVWPLPSMS